MVQKAITKILRKRHYWRYVEFSELAELYASRVLRVMALTMISGFVAVFLYQTGYSLSFIAAYFTLQYGLRGLLGIPSAYVIGRIGPKHATLISNMSYVPALFALFSIESNGLVALGAYLVFQAISASLYNISYNIDFSLVKHRKHVGKELGYMVAIERITMAVSPLIGGFIAYIFGPEITIAFAALIFALAAWPLLLTAEPIRTHQHVTFTGLRWKVIERGIIANFGIGWDFATSGIAWSLFVATTIFGVSGNAVYAKIGIVSAVSIIAAVITSRIYGILIDQKYGNILLHAGTFGSSIINLLRAYVTTSFGVIMTNVTSEAAKNAYAMPFTKGVYDLADGLDKHRVAYLATMDMAISFGASLTMLCLYYLSLCFDDVTSLKLLFAFSAIMILLVIVHRFKALQPRI